MRLSYRYSRIAYSLDEDFEMFVKNLAARYLNEDHTSFSSEEIRLLYANLGGALFHVRYDPKHDLVKIVNKMMSRGQSNLPTLKNPKNLGNNEL